MAACASIMTSATPINIYSAQAPVPIKQETHNMAAAVDSY